jgi:hypothetical protein
VIEPKRLAGDKGQGPQYAEVAAAIHKGEAFGKRKYDVRAPGFTKKDWKDVDEYALMLITLRNESELSANGVFRGRLMKDAEIDSRLWQCNLKVGASNSPSTLKKKREREERWARKKAEADISLDKTFSSKKSTKGKQTAIEANASVVRSLRSLLGSQLLQSCLVPLLNDS